jgi:microcystin-dependent protein
MTVETATYIADLQPTNPPGTDPKSQGDDHIRLIKQVLQNTFTGASRAFQLPSTISKTANYTIQRSDGESIIYCSTAAGAVTLTLPTLTAADQGWKVCFIKTTLDANPIFVVPPSGNVNSGGYTVAKARRAVPSRMQYAIWDGSTWYIPRSHSFPIGTILAYWGPGGAAVAPAGFEWPDGRALAAANYPEYAVALGANAPDIRGYALQTLDNIGGTAAGRLSSGLINGSTLGATGGVDAVTLTNAQIPAHFHGAPIIDPGHSHSFNYTGPAVGPGTGSTPNYFYSSTSTLGGTTAAAVTGVRVSTANGADQTASTGGGGSHSNLQPSIMVARLLVTE